MLVECNRCKTRASLLLDAIRRPEGYLAGTAGCTGVGPGGVGLIGESGWVGVTSAPTSFAELNVVPGGVCGGRRSTIRFVWLTTSRIAIEMAAMITAMIAGLRIDSPITVNHYFLFEFHGRRAEMCGLVLQRS